MFPQFNEVNVSLAEWEIPLSKAEREVALLVKDGLRDKQIAAILGKSPVTVGVQVSSILGKYGFENRTQIATFVTEQTILLPFAPVHHDNS